MCDNYYPIISIWSRNDQFETPHRHFDLVAEILGCVARSVHQPFSVVRSKSTRPLSFRSWLAEQYLYHTCTEQLYSEHYSYTTSEAERFSCHDYPNRLVLVSSDGHDHKARDRMAIYLSGFVLLAIKFGFASFAYFISGGHQLNRRE